MPEFELNDGDSTCMREWKISQEPDLRQAQERDDRFVVPEWIRRTQWRHFWADHDPVHSLSQPANDAFAKQHLWRTMLDGSRGADPFGNPEDRASERGNMSALTRSRKTDLQVPAVYAFIVLVTLAFLAGFLLGISVRS